MATTTEERESPVAEIMEEAPYPDVNAPEEAPETPLTREAVVHLRAAGMELDGAYAVAMALLETVRGELNNPVVGADLTIDEDRAYDLWLLLGELADIIDRKMLRAVFERARGERPHADGPHLSLDEQEIRELIADLYRIGSAAAKGGDMQWDHSVLRNCMNAIGLKVDQMVEDLEESAGMAISDEERDAIFDDVAAWGDEALGLAEDAVESEEVES